MYIQPSTELALHITKPFKRDNILKFHFLVSDETVF